MVLVFCRLIANVFSGFVPSSMCNLVDTVDECKLTGSEFYCPLPEPCSGWLVETCKLNNSCIPAPETLGAWGSWSDCEDCVQSQHFFVGSNGSNSGELYTSRTRNCSDSCSDSLVLSTEDWIAVGVSIVVVLAAIATLVVVRRKRLATKWEQARPRTLGVVSDKYRRKSLDECLEGVDSILLAPDVTGITSTTPVVAQGGAGRVYKSQLLKPVVAHGQWFAKGSAIALKELYSMLLGNGEECAKEFVFLSQLHHRGIVPFLGLFKQRAGDEVSPPRYFLVTKYCSNGHLGDHIESESVPFRTRRAWVADIGFAVQYLHDRNVIHRDLKPENILLDEQLQCQLTDFGLARSFNRQGALTTSIGTVHYMAPEMLDNSHRPRSIKHRRRASSVSSTRNSANAHADVEPSPPVDQAGTSSSPDSENIPVELNSPRTSGPLRKFAPAIDVYSLGILVATIFNAQPPYDGLPTGTVIAGVIAGKLRPDLPAQLSSEGHHLLQRMWHNDPHQRPKMTEFLEAFDEFLSSTPPSM